MKKYILLIIFITVINAVTAQNAVPVNEISNTFINGITQNGSSTLLVPKSKWSLNTYQGISTGFMARRGGYANTVSMPVGVQLNRMITNNVFAFARVSIAPTYTNLRQNFMNTDFAKSGFSNSFLHSNNFGLYQRAEIGLGYTNDARTFQIYGSIGVQKDPDNYRFSMPSNNAWWNGRQMLKQ